MNILVEAIKFGAVSTNENYSNEYYILLLFSIPYIMQVKNTNDVHIISSR